MNKKILEWEEGEEKKRTKGGGGEIRIGNEKIQKGGGEFAGEDERRV